MRSDTDRPSCLTWSVAWAFVFLGALWLLDFPKPMVDDLFHIGAALNLVAGGDFSNPLIARMDFPGHFFFEYPPLHQYALAAWLKIFGLSVGSMTGFVVFMYFLTAISVIAILRRHQAPVWLEWLVPVGVITALTPAGLRPEAIAIGLAMSGFAVIECGCRTGLPAFFAFLLMFLGGSAAPRVTPFAGVLVIVAAFRLWQASKAAGRKRWTFCLPVIGALFVCVAFLLALIDFRAQEFWHTFHFHTLKIVGGSKFALLAFYFYSSLRLEWFWPLLLLAIIFVVLALRQPMTELTRIALLITCAFPVAAIIGGVGFGTNWWILLVLFLTTASVLRQARPSPIWRGLLLVSLLCAFLAANRLTVIKITGAITGKIHPDLNVTAEAQALQPKPGHTLLLDGDVARYVFNYKIPPGSIDFATTMTFTGHYIGVDSWRRGDIFLVSPAAVDIVLLGYTFLEEPPPPKWLPLSWFHFKLSTYIHPRQVFIIPVEKCKGVRPEFVPPGSPPSQEIFEPSP